MLPQAYYRPSHLLEATVILCVPPSVLGDFRSPKVGNFVFPRWKLVTVPKISIDKNGQFGSSENYIWSAR